MSMDAFLTVEVVAKVECHNDPCEIEGCPIHDKGDE